MATLNEGPSPVSGQPLVLLRLEGLALLIGSVALFHRVGGNWLLFALLFLAPDLAMIAFSAGPKIGATVYNSVHTTSIYFAIAGFGVLTKSPVALWIGLIGLAHIGMDRALGFGLKYDTAFGDTHLGRATQKGPKV